MEIRKLQKTGGSSLSLTLPKKWVNELKLKSHDTVATFSRKSGSLQLRPTKLKDRPFVSKLDAKDLAGQHLAREVIANFLAGADEITIYSIGGIKPEQRQKIRQTAESLIGFEIVSESFTEVCLKNILDVSKFSLHQNLDKMFVSARAMFSDSLKALAVCDPLLAKDVVERDFEIDKMHLIIIRHFNAFVQDRITEEDLGLDSGDLAFYEDVGIQLERIADHAVKIARFGSSPDKRLAKIVTSTTFQNISKQILNVFEQAEVMVKTVDKVIAHKILDENVEIEELNYLNRNVIQNEAAVGIIIDSLDRLRGYIMNLAEITIDRAVGISITAKI